jgi:hypothetical protein
MIKSGMWTGHKTLAPAALFGIAAIGIGLAVSFQPSLAISGAILAVGLVGALRLLTLTKESWWYVWLGTMFLAAFGPLLDILSHQPLNWLIGLFVLLLFAVAQFSRMTTRFAFRSSVAVGRGQLPVLGTALLLYILYYPAQIVRPDVDSWNALMAVRAPLIGLASYFLTTYRFRAGMEQDELIRPVRQLLMVLIILGLIVGAYGVFQFLVGFDRLQAWGLTESGARYFHNQRNLAGGTRIFRIFSTMRRNESLGAFLFLAVVASAVGLRLRLKPRLLVLVSLGTSLAALLLTLSLTSLLTLGIWVALILVASRSKRLILTALVLATIGIMVTLLVNLALGGLIGVRFAEHALDVQEDRGRLRMFRNWVEEISERPFLQGMLGSGICTGLDDTAWQRIRGVLGTLGIQVEGRFECGWQRLVIDNWYAMHSLEIGWLGLMLIWLVFGLMAVYTLPRVRRFWREPERGAWTMLTLGVLALWPSGFVGALIMYMPVTLFFWSLVALLDIAAMCPKRKQASSSTFASAEPSIDFR